VSSLKTHTQSILATRFLEAYPDRVNSERPLPFSQNPARLAFDVQAGDTIQFLAVTVHSSNDFIGYDVRLDFSDLSGKKTAFDVADDWSDERNPSGAWSYRGLGGRLIGKNVPKHDLTEHVAWSDTRETTPLWFKSVPDNWVRAGGGDLPDGAVASHGPSQLWWKAPAAGHVRIRGGSLVGSSVVPENTPRACPPQQPCHRARRTDRTRAPWCLARTATS
jgi:hypothetical protein